MHMWVISIGLHFSQTLQKAPCPGTGSNRGPFDLKSSTLPRQNKSWLVPKGNMIYLTYTLCHTQKSKVCVHSHSLNFLELERYVLYTPYFIL